MMLDTLKTSIHLSEDEKLSEDYLKAEIDATIQVCMSQDKSEYERAYNVVNGKRDVQKFSYLWDAYGIEFPAEMRHVPVLRGIFEALDGMNQARPFKYRITSTDEKSTENIIKQLGEKILKELEMFLVEELTMAQKAAGGQPSIEIENLEARIKKLQTRIKNGFQADFEISAQHMLEWLMYKLKVRDKANTMFFDLRTSGQEYYQVKVLKEGQQPVFRELNPLDVFYIKGKNVKYVKDADRVVIREKLPVTEVWSLYGHKMKDSDRERFLDNYSDYINSNMQIVAYTGGNLERNAHDRTGHAVVPFVDVFYTEWKANTRIEVPELDDFAAEGKENDKIQNKKRKYVYRLDRFEGVRVGEDIHVDAGKSKFVPRDPDNPSYVPLSVNGACYGERNGDPYSLVLNTEDIADKIDILHYHAENLLAISGVKAVAMNFADIPAWMGADPMARAMKWLGMVKQGIALVDLTQTGEGVGKFNQMGDIDLSMSTAIQSIFVMIEYLEATAHKITGVPRQALGVITQNDGKGTSQIALQGSQTVTQSLYTLHDEVMEQMLTDLLNASRVAYAKGFQGSYLLGNEGRKIFTLKPGQFNAANWNVFVNGDGTVERDREKVEALAMELVKGQMVDADLAVNMVTFKSLTELQQKVKEAIQAKKEESASNAQSQLEQMQQKVAEYEAQVKKLTTQAEQFKQEDLALKKQEIDLKYGLKDKEVNANIINDEAKIKNDKKRVDLEALELSYDVGSVKEIKNK